MVRIQWLIQFGSAPTQILCSVVIFSVGDGAWWEVIGLEGWFLMV